MEKKIYNKVKWIGKVMWLTVIITVIITVSSCEDMEDTYKEYLFEKVYSPKVTMLTAIPGYQTVTLHWQNPEGDIVEKIEIRYDDVVLELEELKESVVLTDLEVKGYDLSVYTIDKAGNYSVPVTIYVFPNGIE